MSEPDYGRRLVKACPECRGDLILRKSRYGPFYGCSRFPACRGTHGAHPNGDPLGIPADKKTKAMRIMAHEIFDRLWKGPDAAMDRRAAYKWLQKAMRLGKRSSHIGSLDTRQCKRLIYILQSKFRTVVAVWPDVLLHQITEIEFASLERGPCRPCSLVSLDKKGPANDCTDALPPEIRHVGGRCDLFWSFVAKESLDKNYELLLERVNRFNRPYKPDLI